MRRPNRHARVCIECQSSDIVSASSPSAPDPARRERAPGLLLVLSYVGFVSLGLPDTVLGAAWPAMRVDFARPLDAAGAVLLVTTGGSVLSSMLSGHVRARWGTGSVLAASTALAALSLLSTAFAPAWAFVLCAGFLGGLGGGAIDACLNLYVAARHGARHMNWLHASWGIGAALAPTVVASVLSTGAPWRMAYALIGLLEGVLACAFTATRGRWHASAAPEHAHALHASPSQRRASMVASVLLFLLYTGLEAGAGLWAASLLVETRGMTRAAAGGATAAYWAALAAGRFLIGAVAERIGPARVLRGSVVAASIATLALALPETPVWFSIGALSALGMALAPIYPLAMHDTPRRFGADTGARLVGYQVAAASIGVAILPWLLGGLARTYSLSLLPKLWCALAVGLVVLERIRRRSH